MMYCNIINLGYYSLYWVLKLANDNDQIMNKDDDNNDEDDYLWNYVSKDIDKIDKNVASNHDFSDLKDGYVIKKKALVWKNLDNRKLGVSAEVDLALPNKTRKLKRKSKIDAVIDLHGLTQSDAYAELLSFIGNSSRLKRKCVLVITGKGGKNIDEIGVLRRAVPQWFDVSPMSDMIKDYMVADPKDGGSGALYVYIR